MTAKYYNGKAGIREMRVKRCTLCIHAKAVSEAFTQVECSCEYSEHFCHVLVTWHPACDMYEQGIMPVKDPDKTIEIETEKPKRKRGRPRKQHTGEQHA